MVISVSLAASESNLSLDACSSEHRSESAVDVQQNINELTDNELIALTEKKRKCIRQLGVENKIFQTQLEFLGESTLQATESSLKRGASISQTNKKSFGAPGSFLPLTSVLGDRRSQSSLSSVHRNKVLSIANKYYVAKTELNKMKCKNKIESKEREKLVEDIQNNIEETEMHMADIIQQGAEFEQKIIVGGKHPITGNIRAEKLLHYFETRQKSQDVRIQNLRMKTANYRTRQKEITEASKVRIEVIRDVCKVDIDQKKIQVMQGQEEIQIRNEHRLRMKLMTARAKHIVDEKLARLGKLTNVDQSVRQRLAQKRSFVEKLNVAIDEVEREVQAYEQEYAHLNTELKDYCPITAFDIMKLKDALKAIKRTEKNWQRHANIVKLKAKFAKKEQMPEEHMQKLIQDN